MLNEVSLVGIIEKIHEMKTTAKGNQETIITLKIETDPSFERPEDRYICVPVVLWSEPAYMAHSLCKEGSKLGIKGRISCESGTQMNIICEKISFMDRYFKSE
ncbi:MAG: single-stranded DNA-binding protein [Erysipelotrichaceae bacterium]|nr:single-stranded DNA-binding protein [Erysipelotrichaceae bacterium]MDD3808741.1 single-stranded DNA-binding protein [Erysipelotrichaceae bacterium]